MAEKLTESRTKYRKKQKQRTLSVEELNKMSNKDLIEKVIQLEAHNTQLKNILKKKCEEESKKDREEGTEKEGKNNKKYNFQSVSKRHIFLKLFYLGWDCQGYVIQDDTSNTIEYYLFKALERCCLIENRESSNYHRCGRTDKGVSAFSQVISIDVRSKLSEPSPSNCEDELPYCSMLNRLLPDHIKCYAWSHVDSKYSARFDCSSRIYHYYFPRGDLNISLMMEGAKYLIGEHDFRNFCKMDIGNGVTEFIRTIISADIKPCFNECKESDYEMLKLVIEGNGFLWHQVRSIMGVLFLIGQAKESPEVVKHLLAVNENPNKPQYLMANHVPLNLFHSSYDKLSARWNIDEKELCHVIKHLQGLWSFLSVKNIMVKEMIDELVATNHCSSEVKYQVEPLLDGVKSKIYKPLLSRVKCESLENRIEHYVKRRKLIKENEDIEV